VAGGLGVAGERGVGDADELATGGEPVVGGDGEAAGDDRVDRGGQVRTVGGDLRAGVVDVGVEDRQQRPARIERAHAGEALEEHARQRVLIGPPVDAAPLDLLGRDVEDGAHHLAGGGQPAVGVGLLGQPEVGEVGVDLPVPAGGLEQDVGGLDVAVDQPLGVGGVERGGDLGEDLEGELDPDRASRWMS
jgi:hypothetical protein